MREEDVVVSIRITDAVILLVFLVQAISLFVTKRSLFERISGTLVVLKNYQPEPELFSFEMQDGIATASTESINQ